MNILKATPLEQLLADTKERITTLRAFGAEGQGEAIEKFLGQLQEVAAFRALLIWHDEAGAALQSGLSPKWFRARFDGWQALGLARLVGRGRRQYCEIIIPARVTQRGASEDPVEAARRDQLTKGMAA